MSQAIAFIIPFVFAGICLNVIYMIIRSAVKDGTLDALKEKDKMKKIH